MFGCRKCLKQKVINVQKKREISSKDQYDHSRITGKSRYSSKWCCEICSSKSSFLMWKKIYLWPLHVRWIPWPIHYGRAVSSGAFCITINYLNWKVTDRGAFYNQLVMDLLRYVSVQMRIPFLLSWIICYLGTHSWEYLWIISFFMPK